MRIVCPWLVEGPTATEGLRSRVARGRPNWWVILAVSLGLMALLVATAGGTPPAATAAGRRCTGPAAAARTPPRAGAGAAPRTADDDHDDHDDDDDRAATPRRDRPTSPRTPARRGRPALPARRRPRLPSVTTTTVAPATHDHDHGRAPSPSVPADRTQTQGYLNPPLQTSNQYGFTGTGAMEISVVWSGNTYLTMEVSCPSGDQSVGGTSAMAASLPDASGSCLATVSEPTSETMSLTYTITIGPAGG